MPNKIGIWRENLIVTASAITAVHQSEIVPAGDRWFIQSVAVRDQTRVNADALISIVASSHNHAVKFVRALENNEWRVVKIEAWLREGERIRIDWSNVQSADVLDAHLSGHKRYDGEDIL